jgi:RAB6A-GEF complex partner protein 1
MIYKAIAQIVMNADYSLFGIISIDGHVYLCEKGHDVDSGRVKYEGTCVYEASAGNAPVASLSFNPRFTYFAVGNVHGIVHIYEIAGKSPIRVAFSHDIALTNPGDKSSAVKLSAVSSLSWSMDGYALSVAWIYGGFSVWSLFGCLLASTISEDTFVHASDGIVTDSNELFFAGVQELFWCDHSLFILPASSYEKELVLDIYVMEFAKSSMLGSLSDVLFFSSSFIIAI